MKSEKTEKASKKKVDQSRTEREWVNYYRTAWLNSNNAVREIAEIIEKHDKYAKRLDKESKKPA